MTKLGGQMLWGSMAARSGSVAQVGEKRDLIGAVYTSVTEVREGGEAGRCNPKGKAHLCKGANDT
jgi:hypothetical protein